MSKKIAVIYGHPYTKSYNYQLADAYSRGALKHGAELRKVQLNKMDFVPVLQHGYKERMVEEPDLIWAKDTLLWADHLVFVYPIWWGTMPSLLKGFIDRVFTPGYAFEYISGSYFNKKLLKGKSAHVIVTSDVPHWYAALIWKGITKIQIKQTILKFCGVSPVRYTHYGSVKWRKEKQLKKWLEKTFLMGSQLN